MREIPLYGDKAAGRVALVDDADCELVMQYRWRVLAHGQKHLPRFLHARAGRCPCIQRRSTRDVR